MSVYSRSLGTLWNTLESYDIDPATVIDAGLYRPGDVALPSERMSFTAYDDLLARAGALVRDPALGIRTAKFLHPSHLGALGHAWLASSSLRTALLRSQRFHKMFNEQIELQVQELPDRVRATYRVLQQPTHPNELGDAILSGLLKLCQINFGPNLEPVEANLKRPEPPDPKPWFEFFGPTVRFGQPEISLAIARRDADVTLTGSNSELVAVNEEVMRRHLMKIDRDNILNRSRLRIMEQLPSGRITENDLAEKLNISKRTLHRKLREQDETFRSLLLQVRMDLAERYIRNESFSITEIAFLLGYADTSAFSRAFRGWFGLSPTMARERNKAA